MKNILKRIIMFSMMLLISLLNINSYEIVNAITLHTKNEIIEIYDIKEKEEVVISNTIIDFYHNDPNKEEFLEYKKEQERLEQERLVKQTLRENIVRYAKMFVGNPYVAGGNSLIYGTDCSGFVKLVYAKYGYSLPRTTTEQYYSGIKVSLEEIEIGDIISYGYNGYITHSAIYIGNGKIVHAATPKDGIMISDINIIPIEGIIRII